MLFQRLTAARRLVVYPSCSDTSYLVAVYVSAFRMMHYVAATDQLSSTVTQLYIYYYNIFTRRAHNGTQSHLGVYFVRTSRGFRAGKIHIFRSARPNNITRSVPVVTRYSYAETLQATSLQRLQILCARLTNY